MSNVENPNDEPLLDTELETAWRQAIETNAAIEREIGSAPEGDGDSLEPSVAVVEPVEDPSRPRVTPRQVIEAVLFVGGRSLSSRKLTSLVGGESESIEQEIEALNELYLEQARPYEIRLGEGGYRLLLRDEYEAVRNRVFGLGPKEVRLSQEALEVLSLVAYQQPISRQQLEQFGKPNATGMLRQLLRRELIAIERGNNPRRDITYRTTPRFLEVFGVTAIDDLPQPDEIEVR